MQPITKETFKKVLIGADKPVLIDAWSPTCAPCKAMEGIVANLHDEVKGTVDIYQLNVIEEYELADELGIMGLPSFIVIKKGKEVGRSIGMTTKANLLKLLTNEL